MPFRRSGVVLLYANMNGSTWPAAAAIISSTALLMVTDMLFEHFNSYDYSYFVYLYCNKSNEICNVSDFFSCASLNHI